MRSDRPAAIILMVIAAFFIFHARGFRGLAVDIVGPAAYPLFIGGLMAALAATLLIQSIRAPASPPPEWGRHTRPLVFGLALIAYVLTFEWLGFVVSTVIFLAFSHSWLGEPRLLKGTLVAVLITIALWLVFARALDVTLPSGIIGRLP